MLKTVWCLFLLVVSVTNAVRELDLPEDEPDELDANAENVCIDQKEQTKLLNISYLQSQEVADYTWCIKIPPRCRVYRTKLVTKWKEENYTRVVNLRHCCPGYEPNGQGQCSPICNVSCGSHGRCSQPNVCTCEPGFSGEHCQDVGCKGGNWGPDCSRPCTCQNGGRCEPHTGQCICNPGWQGLQCQSQCPLDTFGPDCGGQCDCAIGQRCHHMTGECLPCKPGTFGLRCSSFCECDNNGTALCLHTTGQCFCHPNHYGNQCELHCPYGYVDEVCHTSPIPGGVVCDCRNDQMECDLERGCVCKEGGDCGGGQRLLDLTNAAPLEDNASTSGTVAIVLSVLFLATVMVILIVLYYRRRMKRLQKDLNNRSVYYVQNSILDPGRHHNNGDLVVSDDDLLDGPGVLSDGDNAGGRPELNINEITINSNSVPNNAGVATAATTSATKEKNVNIDRFKLGTAAEDLVDPEQGACCSVPEDDHCQEDAVDDSLGACGATSNSRPKNCDVNVFEEDDSPRKIKKTNLEQVFQRNDLRASDSGRSPAANANASASASNSCAGQQLTGEEEERNEHEEDEITIAKMASYLDQTE